MTRSTTISGAVTWFPHQHFVNGDWVSAEKEDVRPVVNPATGLAIAQVAWGHGRDTMTAIDYAHQAFTSWRRTSATNRATLLSRVFAVLMANKSTIGRIIALENGKPIEQAAGEVDYAASFFRWFSEQARVLSERAVSHPDPSTHTIVAQEPLGVVGAITPWNFPLAQAAKKISAALAAGCTVVLKPAPETPLSALALAWACEEAGLPSGTVNVVHGDAESIGKAMLEHTAVRCLSFTGSVKVGAELAGKAAAKLKIPHLELGGNAPFIVLDDADLPFAADQLVKLKILTNGQTCVTANRLLVHRKVADVFTGMVLSRFQKIKVGDPLDPETTLGPLIHQQAVEIARNLVISAVEDGAHCVFGRPEDPLELDDHLQKGTFFPPTLLTHCKNSMQIAQTEIFAPVLPVITFTDDDDAVALANDTSYGLAAYIYSQDTIRANDIASQLDVGIIGINDMRPLRAEVPFGGVKESGMGREGGIEGLMDYLSAKTISTHRHGVDTNNYAI